MTFMCLFLYGRHLSDKNIAENEAMICSAAWWKQWISPRFKSSFLVLFCFLYGVTYKPTRAGQNCYTWCCYPQWMYLQVTIIKIYLSIYLYQIARFVWPTWAHLGPPGPRWAPRCPHQSCYEGWYMPECCHCRKLMWHWLHMFQLSSNWVKTYEALSPFTTCGPLGVTVQRCIIMTRWESQINQTHNCLLNRLFRRRSKKTSKLWVTGLCGVNSPVTSEFPAQRASNAGNVSIWWRHVLVLIDVAAWMGW